jgi:hypothetical protein
MAHEAQFLLNQSLAELGQRIGSKFTINSFNRSWAGLGYENLQEQDRSPVISGREITVVWKVSRRLSGLDRI